MADSAAEDDSRVQKRSHAEYAQQDDSGTVARLFGFDKHYTRG